MDDMSNNISAHVILNDKYQQLMELEVKEVAESFRWLATQLLNVATVLVVVNITVVGFAASNRQAGMFLVGACVTLILLGAFAAGMLGAVPLMCRLLLLEQEASQVVGTPIITGVSFTFLGVLGAPFTEEAKHISGLSSHIELQKAMRHLTWRLLTRFRTKYGTAALLIVALGQIAFVPILVFVFGWGLF